MVAATRSPAQLVVSLLPGPLLRRGGGDGLPAKASQRPRVAADDGGRQNDSGKIISEKSPKFTK